MSQTPNGGQGQTQQVQLRVDDQRATSTYANVFFTRVTGDEVLLDFGINLPQPSQDGQPRMTVQVGSRVVLNWRAAKQLAISLGQVVKRFEEQNGEIPIGQQRSGGSSGGGSGVDPTAPRLAE